MAEGKKSFVAYCDWGEVFEQLTDTQAGQLAKHLFRYVNDTDPETKDPIVNIAFTPIKQQLKRDLVKYEERAERSRSNGSKGGRPLKTEEPSGFSGLSEEPRKPDTVNVNDIKKKRNTNVFQRPTIEQVKEYCDQRGNKIDPAAFIDHYNSNGWKVGRNSMKDWRAAVHTWERNGFESKTVGGIPATPDMAWWSKATDDQRKEAAPVWITAGYYFHKVHNTWKANQ